MKSAGRQTIAGAEAASAAKSSVASEKHIGAPPDGGPTEGRRMGLSLGYLPPLAGYEFRRASFTGACSQQHDYIATLYFTALIFVQNRRQI